MLRTTRAQQSERLNVIMGAERYKAALGGTGKPPLLHTIAVDD